MNLCAAPWLFAFALTASVAQAAEPAAPSAPAAPVSSAEAAPSAPPAVPAKKTEAELAAERRAAFAGSWRWVGGEREAAARDAAVDKGIESLFFAIRGMARSHIKSSVEIAPQVRFAFGDGNVTIAASGKPQITAPEDGRAIPFVGHDGKHSKLSQAFKGDRSLVQRFDAEEGGRIITYSLSSDGKILRAQFNLHSPKLSNPIVYTLTYRR